MEVKKSTFFNQNYEDCCTFDRSKVYILLKKWAFLLLLASQKEYILLKKWAFLLLLKKNLLLYYFEKCSVTTGLVRASSPLYDHADKNN